MSYKQVKAFNQKLAGKVAGSCLANTRKGFGINSKYPNAWQAWVNTQKHTDTPPMGVDVPVFFSYINANYGHVGVRLANGSFWSDGNIYTSIEAYQVGHAPRYVGWGESLNGVRVIEYVADPAPKEAVSGKHITLPADSGAWHLYHEQGPYTVASGKWVTILHPSSQSGGYTYPIVADKGNGIYVIQSPQWGHGALYTAGSKFMVK